MKLMQAKRFSDACPKLEESQRIDPGLGTQYNLADCYEKTGKTASAWINFSEVADAALKDGNAERERVARGRAAAVQQHLSYLTVRVERPVAGLAVKRDGVEMRATTFGIASPMDPGTHVIEVSAPNKHPYRTSVELGKKGDKVEVTVPELHDVDTGRTAKPAIARDSAAPDGSKKAGHFPQQKTWALVSAGIGVVGVGMGTGLLISAASTHSQASSDCDSNNVCQSTNGKSLLDEAHSRANLATIPLGIGIVGLAAGVTLWLTAPSTKEGPVAELWLTSNQLALRGRF
jgi:serine/threonine-protein kinase